MPSSDRPNILYIMTDQQRFDIMSLYGRTCCRTPHLDQLAQSGMRFDNAYTVCALCSPARASMLSGKYPHRHRMWNNNDMMQWAIRDLPADVELISQPLARAGRRCGFVGKWHCGRDKVPSTYGLEGMDVPNYGNPYATSEYRAYLDRNGLRKPERKPVICDGTEHERLIAGELVGDVRAASTYFLADYAIDMMERFQQGGQPWMQFVSFWLPHAPYLPPTEYAQMYRPSDVALWPNFDDALDNKPPHQARYRKSFHRLLAHDEAAWREIIARYFAQMTFLDSQIGRVLAALDDLGISDTTAVLFGTDHGDMCGSHGRFFDKGSYMYEEIYHVPQIVRWPGVTQPGSVCNEFVTNMDLAATALDVAGVDVPDDYQARSLAPLLRGDADAWPDDVVCEYHGHRYLFSQRMLRWSHYKYVFNAASFDELYDLDADPHELHNCIDSPAYADVAKEGRARLLRRIIEHDDPLRHAAEGLLDEHA